MECVHIGQQVRWGRRWVRAGDEYRCATCGATVVVGLAAEGTEDRSEIGRFLEMEGE